MLRNQLQYEIVLLQLKLGKNDLVDVTMVGRVDDCGKDTPRIWCVLMLYTHRCPTQHSPMITLNYVIFSSYYRCRRVGVSVLSGVRVCDSQLFIDFIRFDVWWNPSTTSPVSVVSNTSSPLWMFEQYSFGFASQTPYLIRCFFLTQFQKQIKSFELIMQKRLCLTSYLKNVDVLHQICSKLLLLVSNLIYHLMLRFRLKKQDQIELHD